MSYNANKAFQLIQNLVSTEDPDQSTPTGAPKNLQTYCAIAPAPNTCSVVSIPGDGQHEQREGPCIPNLHNEQSKGSLPCNRPQGHPWMPNTFK